jgi:alkane 1-monooxygenase
MMQFTIMELIYIGGIFFLSANNSVFLAIMGAALVGALLLETINYIEHYGLQRNLLDNGRYERVQPKHSWNANFHFGRIILYELTRHSDHHFIASKKYQILEHHQSSPQLPYGYPMSMLISFVPPLWFWIMHPLLNEINKN